jgi:hypothetical protein
MRNRVEVTTDGKKWSVLVEDEGGQHHIDFLHEASALSFADGQRLRLGLPVGAEAHTESLEESAKNAAALGPLE